jgi:RNA polymerase sigma-70 factor (ECF subfamily)
MPLQDQPLERIIGDLRDGKEREGNFHLLFVRFYSQVCRYFQGKGIPVEDSEDLAQDVFCEVFRSLESLRDAEHFPGWLFTISRNMFNNEIGRRHAKKRSAAATLPQSEGGSRDILDTFESRTPCNVLKGILNKEKVHALSLELRKLPDQMRRCVCLRVIHEYSDEQIATLLGISSNTVRVHVFRARKALNDALGPVFGDLRI